MRTCASACSLQGTGYFDVQVDTVEVKLINNDRSAATGDRALVCGELTWGRVLCRWYSCVALDLEVFFHISEKCAVQVDSDLHFTVNRCQRGSAYLYGLAGNRS